MGEASVVWIACTSPCYRTELPVLEVGEIEVGSGKLNRKMVSAGK